MLKLELTENLMTDKPKKLLSFPTREFKKVEYIDRDGQPAQGYMVKKDKLECEVVSGMERITLPVDKVQEIKPVNGDGRKKPLSLNEAEPNKPVEKKFNYLDQYDGREVPEDWALIGRDANGKETLLLGDVAGVDVLDDDPNSWMFVDAKTRQQMIVDRREIFDVRADKTKFYFFTDTDENGREFTHHGYLSTVMNGRCFFESADTHEVLVLNTDEVFSANNLMSVAMSRGEVTEEIELIEEEETIIETEEQFDYRAELIRRLDQVVITPPPRTEQQKFIEMGRTKTMINEMSEQERMIENEMADYFVAKTADRLRGWEKTEMFKYFTAIDWQELDYQNIYTRVEAIKSDWEANQKSLAFVQQIRAEIDERSQMSKFHYYREQAKTLEEERQAILERMNFVKRQVNKLDYLQRWEKELGLRLGESEVKQPGQFIKTLTAEERGIVARYVRQKIKSCHTSADFEKFMKHNLESAVGEIKVVRQLNAGEWRNVWKDIWGGIKKSWADWTGRLAEKLTQPTCRPLYPTKTWWQRVKGWFKG